MSHPISASSTPRAARSTPVGAPHAPRPASRLLGLAYVALSLAAAPGRAAAPAPPAAAAAPQPRLTLSDTCMACHNGLTAPDGSDVSLGAAWRGSMMANAARDPYWLASVRRETRTHPAAAAAIEHECSRCHAPLSHAADVAAGGTGRVFAHLSAATAPGEPAALAADAVSCAVCHQIGPDRLGTPASFTGGYVFAAALGGGVAPALGPFAVEAGLARVMRSASGFAPTEAPHLQQSEVCATCHTLYTHALDAAGNVVGTLPEQVPYLEWRASDYADAMHCQDCHMPVRPEPLPVSSVLGQPRAHFSEHVFRGGNGVVPRMLSRRRLALGVQASPQELMTAVARARDHLGKEAALLRIDDAACADGVLAFTVSLMNQAGHKFPTAYPSRRAWLHVNVTGSTGALLFESGAPGPDGAIAGNDNDADPARYEPHYQTVSDPAEVQIYESILGTPAGAVTTGLLTASRYLKDNRLLPAGFDPTKASPDVAVTGEAAADPDFSGGGDRVRYRIAVPPGSGPYAVRVSLLYQPIGYRWARNLEGLADPEPLAFLEDWAAVAGESATIVAATRFSVP